MLKRILAIAALSFSASSLVCADTVLQGDAQSGYKLIVDGKPFWVQGVGGSASRQTLKDIGGNAFRTWGVGPDTRAQLDEAQKLGLKVCFGLWMQHERRDFDYNNIEQVAKQYEEIKEAVLEFKDHPAILCWAIGNEMEGYALADDAAIWSAVNNVASMVKKIDPTRPTMTVVAELGGKRVEAIHKLCPDIDIIGINSYAGCQSIPGRYRALGGTKPYMVTEFGPQGTWEIPKNDFDVVMEPTGEAKANHYRVSYEKGILAEKDKLCLGSFVFNWGSKAEATATWFGMFLPDGARTAAVDVMQEFWTGSPPADKAPALTSISVAKSRVDVGATIDVKLSVTDPEKGPLKTKWVVMHEQSAYGEGGDAEAPLVTVEGAVLSGNETGAKIKLPNEAGRYRIYAYAYDQAGNGAVGTVPVLAGEYVKNTPAPAAPPVVKDKAPVAPPVVKTETKKADEPASDPNKKPKLVIFGNGQKSSYIPSGWMGKTEAIKLDEKSTNDPKTGPHCMQLEFISADNFGGIVWQSPADDWGDKPGGHDLTGATALKFWARGSNGGETVEFKYGIIGEDKPFHDSSTGAIVVTLDEEWKEYSIDLHGKDMSMIKTGFVWVVAGQGAPIKFFLDEIRYE